MGLFDFIGGGNKVEKLQKAAVQKFGPPENRQKALDQLAALDTPEATSALLRRFTIAVDPSITDREEKDFTYRCVVDKGEKAVEPLRQFLMQSDTGIAWAIKAMAALLTKPDLAKLCIDVLEKVGPDYTRDPEKKVVLLSHLSELQDERIGTAVLPFLADPADDVKTNAAKVLSRIKGEPVRAALLEGLVREHDKKRVVAAFVEAIADAGFNVGDQREKVAPLIADPFVLNKDGTISRKS
jgi:HEAT repeat protein